MTMETPISPTFPNRLNTSLPGPFHPDEAELQASSVYHLPLEEAKPQLVTLIEHPSQLLADAQCVGFSLGPDNPKKIEESDIYKFIMV